MSIYDDAVEMRAKTRELNERLANAENTLEAIGDDDTREEVYQSINEVVEILGAVRADIY